MIALLFPGQAADAPGMGIDVAESDGTARRLLELASELTGQDVLGALRRGRALSETAVLQPTMTAVTLGAYAALRAASPEVAVGVVAGHSLGELAAWSAAGWLSAEDAVRLAHRRGVLMSECVDHLDFEGGMLAIRGDVDAIVTAEPDIVVAAHNGAEEWVLSGPTDRLRALAGTYGGRLLSVPGPWHHPAMEPAIVPFRAAIRELEARPLDTRIICNRTGTVVDDSSSLGDLLAGQLVRPIAWSHTLDTLAALGVDVIVTMGPGRVLRHQVRHHPLLGAVPVLGTETARDIARTARSLARDELE